MFLVDRLILLAGVLLLVGILSSKVSVRTGLPGLVLFLVVGMLAGEEGLGGIVFDDFRVAHAIGTVALGLILFDGGLQTRTTALRQAWKPAAVLATLGVLVTAVITGAAASVVLGLPWTVGLLLGSIVASTDAAAVFLVLRSQGLHVRPRVAATLEIESGSNDPMAIFLTIGLVEILAGRMEPGLDLLNLFLAQMGIGGAAGIGLGWLGARLINRIDLDSAGLYPLLAGACGLIAFGVAAALGGSGFLAVYLVGIVLGNSRLVFQRGTFLFTDGLAWMGQISMFVVLGLLSMPSELLAAAGPGLLVAVVLMCVARPLSVVPVLWPLGFTAREQAFISWGGLKGAVPITLATFPLMAGLPDGRLISTPCSSSCSCRRRCRAGPCPPWRPAWACRRRSRRSRLCRWNCSPCVRSRRTSSSTRRRRGPRWSGERSGTYACRKARSSGSSRATAPWWCRTAPRSSSPATTCSSSCETRRDEGGPRAGRGRRPGTGSHHAHVTRGSAPRTRHGIIAATHGDDGRAGSLPARVFRWFRTQGRERAGPIDRQLPPGPVPGPRPHRCRRHGRGVPGPRHEARPRRRHQGAAAGRRR